MLINLRINRFGVVRMNKTVIVLLIILIIGWTFQAPDMIGTSQALGNERGDEIREAARKELEVAAFQLPFFSEEVGAFNPFSHTYSYDGTTHFTGEWYITPIWPPRDRQSAKNSQLWINGFPVCEPGEDRDFLMNPSQGGPEPRLSTPLGDLSCLYSKSETRRISTVPGGKHTLSAEATLKVMTSCWYVNTDVRLSSSVPSELNGATKDPAPKKRRELQDSAEKWVKEMNKNLMEPLLRAPECSFPKPIVFLPGVAGTELYQGSIETLNQVWPFSPRGIREDMVLSRDGATPFFPGSSIVPGRILRSGLSNFYGDMIEFMEEKGYSEGRDLFTFPYDWRLDNAEHFSKLDAVIKNAKAKSGSDKVILLAHSMGGVIARAYIISSQARASNVDALITMGTPYFGSTLPYHALVNGYTFGNPTVRPELMKILMQNYSATYQLIPQIPFIYDSANNRVLTLEESHLLKYKGIIDVSPSCLIPPCLTPDIFTESTENIWSFNEDLLESAKEFNRPLGSKNNPTPLPAGVKHYVIVGYGVQTLGNYAIRPPKTGEKYLELDGRKIVLIPGFTDGDGTVPLSMLEISTATATYYVEDISGTTKYKNSKGIIEIETYLISAAHGDLPDNPKVQQIIWAIVKGTPPDPNSYSYKAPKTYRDVQRLDITLHSDAHMTIIDKATGGTLGYNSQGGVDDNLHSGTFLSIDGVEYASIANLSRTYIVMVNGTGEGKFTLTVNISRASETAALFSYQEVLVTNRTSAKVIMTPSDLLESEANSIPNLVAETNGVTQEHTPEVLVSPKTTPLQSPIGSQYLFLGIAALSAVTILIILSKKKRTR